MIIIYIFFKVWWRNKSNERWLFKGKKSIFGKNFIIVDTQSIIRDK
jgi:hypothetical protein